MEEFDYRKAMAELEGIARMAESPDSGLEEIDSCIERASALIEACRRYLRTAREKVDDLGEL